MPNPLISTSQGAQRRPQSPAIPVVFVLAFALVALTHLTLLHLPYFWDEGGYYVPAALDFFHRGTLIPAFTNAHPPLPNVVLGTLYHLFGFHILVTRLTACAFAAAGLTAVFALGRRLLGPWPGLVLALLTALYPIWFAQSSLAHADIFAAAFTLAALAIYLPSIALADLPSTALIGSSGETFSPSRERREEGECRDIGSCHLDRSAQRGAEIPVLQPETADPTSSAVPHHLDRRPKAAAERSAVSPKAPSTLRWPTIALTAALFSLAALAKETAIVFPAALFAYELASTLQHRADPAQSKPHLRLAAALAVPIPVLAAWYAYHRAKTGFTFGNPVYLRYNATANFTLAHVAYALRIRFVHLAWQRNLWLPLTLAVACAFLPSSRSNDSLLGLPRRVTLAIAVLVLANWLAFSVLGGALLTRYLLPVYPLLLLVCLAVWRDRTDLWPYLAALTTAAFLPALWLNPSTFFAPEDNLTYRDMIVVQQQAIDYLNQHFPNATVLTAWPVSADLTRPDLGYTGHTFKVEILDNFTDPELTKAAENPSHYDTALVFTTHYTTPAFRRFLLTHSNSWRARRYAEDIDLTPDQIAAKLGGQVVWQTNHYGEWAAILRFPRAYSAQSKPPSP